MSGAAAPEGSYRPRSSPASAACGRRNSRRASVRLGPAATITEEWKERQMDHILGEGSNVLVTGATGFIGGELVRRLETFTRGSVWCLVRPRDDEGPAERLAAR